MINVALVGNPNSGKTTMYNALTGRNEKVGNWAGVTVEAKEHLIKNKFYKGEELIAVDLPGAYSMSHLLLKKVLRVIMLQKTILMLLLISLIQQI